MLTERREAILWSLIQEYVATAMPVPSQTIARDYGLGVSPATVRNEMAILEEEGYIFQPHTSAGRVPSVKGYRYYVEALLRERNLPDEEQRTIRHQFYQLSRDIDELAQLSATILARMLNNIAIVTSPRQAEPRLKLINLIGLKEFSILLVLVFQNASFSQQVISTEQDWAQEDLNIIGRKLSLLYEGLTSADILMRKDSLTVFEEDLRHHIVEMMEQEKKQAIGQPHLDGLSQILSQPEFVKSERARILMELLEERNVIKSILSQAPEGEDLRVIIGSDDPESMLRDLSIVLSRYGAADEASGIVGIVGPMRMQYDRAFPAVRFLSGTLSELLQERFG